MATGRELIPLPSRSISVSRSVTLGQDVQTGEEITIGDIERRSGLYVLGRTGSGKTGLLVSLMDQDIRNGHGLFLLDPHGDAIEKLITRTDPNRLQNAVILDPRDNDYSFGINLLACRDPKNWRERTDTFERAKAIFDKIFYPEQMPRLYFDTIINNALPVLIENQQYTLAELPLFLEPGNSAFRERVLESITEETKARDYWRDQFPKTETEQRRLVEPLLNRVSLLLHQVNHIIGQKQTTVDFERIIQERNIVLVKLPAQPTDARRFIGTILVSELLQAVRKRGERPEHARHQFCVFVDEFQSFVALSDFQTLFTEARKWGIATTLAHQERFGQFANEQGLRGATDAAGNKIHFRLSNADAREVAPEFADKPTPAEVRLERVYGISQEPVRDLLQGALHSNSDIRQFVRRYLVPLKERLEDLRDEMDYERIVHMDFFAQAMLFRIDDAIVTMQRDYSSFGLDQRRGLLGNARQMVLSARDHTSSLMALHHHSVQTKWTIRGFNKFFTAVMEGEVQPWPGNEQFAQFLAERACAYSRLSDYETKILELYIAVEYGDPALRRAIPFEFAQTAGLFINERRLITNEANEKAREERVQFRERFFHNEWTYRFYSDHGLQPIELTVQPRVQPVGFEPEDDYEGFLYTDFALAQNLNAAVLVASPQFAEYLAWRNGLREEFSAWFRKNANWPFDVRNTYKVVQEQLRLFRADRERRLSGKLDFAVDKLWQIKGRHYGVGKLSDLSPTKDLWIPWHIYQTFFWIHTYPEIRNCLASYTKSEFAAEFRSLWDFIPMGVDPTISLICKFLTEKYGRNSTPFFKEPTWDVVHDYRLLFRRGIVRELVSFLQTHKEAALVMLLLVQTARDAAWFEFPQIAGRDPLDTLHVLNKLNTFMCEKSKLPGQASDYFSAEASAYFVSPFRLECRNFMAAYPSRYNGRFEATADFSYSTRELKLDNCWQTEEVQRLLSTLKDRWDDEIFRKRPEAHAWHLQVDKTAFWYVTTRACHLVFNPAAITDTTYPVPLHPGAASMIDAYIAVQDQLDLAEAKKRTDRLMADAREKIDRECEQALAKKTPVTLLSKSLSDRVLDANERRAVLDHCLQVLENSGPAMNALQVIQEFVRFCQLLSKPENFVMGPTGVYQEKPVLQRPIRDMEAEKAQELLNLPPRIAYAMVIQETQGEHSIGKHKIRTLDLSSEHSQFRQIEQLIRGNTIRLGYIRNRREVQAEMHQRQTEWRSLPAKRPPPLARNSRGTRPKKQERSKPPPTWE